MRERTSAQWTLSPAMLIGLIIASLSGFADANEAEIVAPAFGRPAIVAPGESFNIDVVTDGAAPTAVELVSSRHQDHRYTLAVSHGPAASTGSGGAIENGGMHRLRAKVETSVPEGQYDLVVSGGEQSATRAHCVSVRRLGARLRVVVIGSIGVGEPCVPRFDSRLVNDINLRGPQVVVLLGGYVGSKAANATVEWERLRSELRRIDAAVVAACGAADPLEDFSREFGPSPIGAITIGPHRVIVAYDPPADALSQNSAQREWLRGALTAEAGSADGALLLVGPRAESSDFVRSLVGASPTTPRGAAEGAVAAQSVADGKPVAGLLTWVIADTPAVAAPSLAPAPRLALVRSIPAMPGCGPLDSAGFSILDFGPSSAGEWRADLTQAQVGELAIDYEMANDGTVVQLPTRLINRTDRVIDGAVFRARVSKASAGTRPWAVGGRLIGLADHHEFWEATVSADVPAHGAIRVVVGSGERPAANP
ncbi:MAG: hypothetical protein SF069_10620 [Phycisphaerae bacterium]|nr:hypothetical protein [Phycisphaerae bacterium]